MSNRFVPALASLLVLAAGACSSPPKPKPLPGGPPPEYEAPRSFELPGHQAPPAEAPAPTDPPPPP
ncbi:MULTISPECIES: hypothetical protein [Polyangium]|uniref:Uncharacterized protein n=2 Tax=Polyangium TaxID=55 RepID=A0A4V5PLF6_9BACT|nr:MULTISPECIES: hypothetical protein [Polyangium]MDI1431125.1 hypothetical protein [Polyangium sorediatum]TKC99124.1 hypothetical protein E8A74_38980 [Polyangium fumosum]